jgi:hypothetical protein
LTRELRPPPGLRTQAFSNTPCSVHSKKRRCADELEQIPVAFSAFHWQPVRNTNKIAFIALRSGTRFWLRLVGNGPNMDLRPIGIGSYGQRLRAKVAGTARALGTRLFQLGDAARVEGLYLRLLEADLPVDALLAPAVRCLVQSGRRAEARALVEARKGRPEPASPEPAEAEKRPAGGLKSRSVNQL